MIPESASEIRTPQDMFSFAYAFILKQGAPSFVEGMGLEKGMIFCRYRDPNDKNCAIGCLLKNDAVRRFHDVDTHTARTIFENFRSDLAFVSDLENLLTWRDLAQAMQQAHDRAAYALFKEGKDFLPLFRLNMADVAREYNLTVPEV